MMSTVVVMMALFAPYSAAIFSTSSPRYLLVDRGEHLGFLGFNLNRAPPGYGATVASTFEKPSSHRVSD
uniref:Putative secreted protein n=1 Tax=Anopheles marajoara TaxID=58244 RepID=A0A2M4CET4_9DIPT